MIRHEWSPRKLQRQVHAGGLIWTRPALTLRVRWDGLPSKLPPNDGYCYRHWQLVEAGWPPDLAALFTAADHGWKYVDIWPDDPRHLYVQFLGYTGKSVRPLLPRVVDLVQELQRRGARVEVR